MGDIRVSGTSRIPTWARLVYRAELGLVWESTYARVTEIEAISGGRARIEAALERRSRPTTLPANSRWCSCCGHIRLRPYFNHDASRPDGLDYWCRGCRAEQRERLKLLHPEREAARRERERERQRVKRGSVRRYVTVNTNVAHTD